jgi:PhzF family phenazine biosynthesis protein
MQKIARELNLSETVFIVSSDRADCEIGVRIFTPGKDMLFAGQKVGIQFFCERVYAIAIIIDS